ncbi:MAG: hypothetical protein RMA76_17055 [Deltaproteobacteria bacterium]|jgi:hypothetical protein
MKRWSILASFALLSACAHAKIPRTNIDDTEANREIIALVERYHEALESLDADAVLSMVSPRFYEDNGNTNDADDYDYNGLKMQLVEDFKRTRALQLDVRVDAVEVKESEAYAELYYRIRAQNEYPSGVKWETGSDRTRLRFERADGKWLIVAGL